MKQVKAWFFGGLLAVMLAGAALVNYQWGQDAIDAGDTADAIAEFTLLAEAGDAEAQYQLGLIYLRRELDEYYAQGGDLISPLTEDNSEAVKLIRLAAEAGHIDAQKQLRHMYVEGMGIERDGLEAVEWYRRVAEAGDIDAQYTMGILYASGEYVEQDDAEAVKWFRLAAEAGDVGAQISLGRMYEEGRGVAQDDRLAHMWYILVLAQDFEDPISLGLYDLVKRMTPLQIIEAQEMSLQCLAQNYKGC